MGSGGSIMPATPGSPAGGTIAATQIFNSLNAVNRAASPYSVAASDSYLRCDASAGAVTIALPPATGSGREITIIKTDPSPNSCSPAAVGTDTIDGIGSYTITMQYASSKLVDAAPEMWLRPHVNQNFGDVIGTSLGNIVTRINGVALASLGTGILKNSTGTGAPSIASAADFPTLNQSTTGNAATASQLAGSPNGCSPGQYSIGIAANGNSSCSQIAYAQLSGAPSSLPPSGTATGDLSQNYPNPIVSKINGVALASLSTGILKNTNGTGQPSIASAADFPTLNQSTTGNAATATTASSLAGFPGQCTSGKFATGIQASGDANCSTPTVSSSAADLGAMQYAAGAGTANAQTVTLTPAPASYSSGMIVRWLPANQNTNTAPTLNVNGLGAVTIVRTTGAALAVGDVSTTQIAVAVYNATSGKFQLLNPQVSSAASVACSGTQAGQLLVSVDNSGSASGNCDPNLIDGNPSVGVLTYNGTMQLTASGNGSWGVTSNGASAPAGTANEVDYTAQSNKPGFTANGGSFQLFPVGPASSTANDIVTFAGTDGSGLADSGVSVNNVMRVVYSTPSASGQSGNIGSTLMTTVPAGTHAYMLSIVTSVTTQGSGCTGNSTITPNVIFTAPDTGAAQQTKNMGAQNIGSNNGVVGYGSDTRNFFVAAGGTTISYSTTNFTTGANCAPAATYQIWPTLTQQW